MEIISLSLHRFECRANRDSELGSNTTPRLEIRIWYHHGLVQSHESNDSLRIGKWASVENHIFLGKLDDLDLRKIAIT